MASATHQLGDPDGDMPWSEDEGDDACCVSQEQWPAEPVEGEGSTVAPPPISLPIRPGRRIVGKRPAHLTAYAHIVPLGTKHDQQGRKRKIQEILKEN